MARIRNTDAVVVPWFIRLGLYVAIAVFGGFGVIRGWVDQSTVDGWLEQSGYLAALISSVVASLNVTRDRKVTPATPAPTPDPVAVADPAPAPAPRSLLDELRDAVAKNG